MSPSWDLSAVLSEAGKAAPEVGASRVPRRSGQHFSSLPHSIQMRRCSPRLGCCPHSAAPGPGGCGQRRDLLSQNLLFTRPRCHTCALRPLLGRTGWGSSCGGPGCLPPAPWGAGHVPGLSSSVPPEEAVALLRSAWGASLMAGAGCAHGPLSVLSGTMSREAEAPVPTFQPPLVPRHADTCTLFGKGN